MQLHHSKHHVNCVNNLNATKEKYKEDLAKGNVIIQSAFIKVQIGVGLVSLSNKDTYKLLPVLIRIHCKEPEVLFYFGRLIYGSMLITFSMK
ncbi:hypothetical protein GH733_015083, partial [Mirounga leonina]